MTDAEIRASWERDALRDQFAAAALTGLLAGDEDAIAVLSPAAIADFAYTCADAFLLRRAQPPAPSTAQTAPNT